MDFITEKVLIAFLKKGLVYELDGMDTEMELEMDFGGILGEDETMPVKIKVKAKVDKMNFQITNGNE